MVCRLCLNNITCDSTIELFDIKSEIDKLSLVGMIFKFLDLKLQENDPISTHICDKCYQELFNIKSYRQYIQKQQKLLQCKVALSDISLLSDLKALNEPIIDVEKMLNVSFMETNLDQSDWFDDSGSDYKSDQNSITTDEEDKLKINFKIKSKFKIRNSTRLYSKFCKQEIKEEFPNNDSNGIYLSDINFDSTNEEYQSPKKKRKHYKRIRNLEYHKRRDENLALISNFMQLNCDLCKDNLVYSTFQELEKHCRDIHKQTPIVKCCNIVFHRPSTLAEHIKWHRNPEIFRCEVCHKQYRNKASLRSHLSSIHGAPVIGQPVQCEICNKQFRDEKRLGTHLLNHSEKKNFSCDICNKAFINKQRLKSHIDSIHRDVYPHICETCGKKFKCKAFFERHLLAHQGIVDPPVQCHLCGAWLKNKHTFRLHSYKHDKINVKCDICGRSSSTKSALRRHIFYSHKKQAMFQCEYCEKKFKDSRALMEHVATHTGAQLYSCNHCSKEFRSKANMYVHIKRQHQIEWLKSKEDASNGMKILKNQMETKHEELKKIIAESTTTKISEF